LRRGKLVAPIIVGAALIVYFCFWVFLCVSVPELPMKIKLAGILIPLALIGVTLFVMIQRIREIRSGEEDDLGKY